MTTFDPSAISIVIVPFTDQLLHSDSEEGRVCLIKIEFVYRAFHRNVLYEIFKVNFVFTLRNYVPNPTVFMAKMLNRHVLFCAAFILQHLRKYKRERDIVKSLTMNLCVTHFGETSGIRVCKLVFITFELKIF